MDEPVDVNAVFDDVKDFLADEAFLVFLQELLDKKERKKLISEAIESAGLSKSKATLLAVPVDWIFIQCVNRAVKTGGGAVQSRLLKFYDSLLRTPACARLATFLSKQLFVELHTKYRTQTTINALLSANTLTLSLRDEDKRWVDVLEKLNLLTLQLQGLEARCTLRSQNLSTPEIDKPSTLLMPDSRFIKQLVGRDREQAELQGFALSEAPFLYGVISGEGGSGKTRLALSLCDAMQEEGWTSGFLANDALEALVSHPCFDLWTPPPNTLIVIDYAQSKSGKGGALIKLLQRLLILAEEESLHAVRLLLLEREAERESGWLFDLSINLEAPQRVAAHALSYHHWQLDSDTEQSPEEKSIFTQALLQATLNAYSELQHASPRALPAWEESEWLQLAEQTGLRPLCLIIAGLQYAETGDERTLLSANLKTLLHYVVEKERRHIELCAADSIISSHHLSLAVAFLTLIGSQVEESDDCRMTVHQCAQAIGCDAVSLKEGLRKVCSRVVEDEYGDKTHRLIPVGPDLIAGPFIFQILGIDASQRRKILSAAVERNPSNAWEKLWLYGIDLEGWGSKQEKERYHHWFEQVIEEIDHKETLAPLLPLVSPLHTQMHLVRTAYAVKICELTETEAYWKENLGLRLTASVIFAENGNYKRAMKISEEITSIYERLATENPAAYEPDLAMSLNNLANRYSENGRRNEAIAPAEKARDIYECLATENPVAYGPNLARNFGTLGTIYVDLGKPLDGAVFFKRGIETLSRLFLQSPQYFSKLMANLVWCYEKNCSSDDEFQASDLYKKIVQILKQQSSSTAED